MGFGGYLQANTAVDVLIGPFIDDTDGKTAETALTLSQADIKLSKNGQALAQKNDDTAAAHDANGYYNCELDTTDTNTEGTLTLIVHESGALPVRHDFMVLAQAAYISLVTAKDSGFMDINVKAVSEDTTAADNCELMFDGTGYAGGTARLKVDVDTIKEAAVAATSTVTFQNGTVPKTTDLGTVQTGDNYAIVNGDHGLVSIQDDMDTVLTRLVGTILAGNHTAQSGDAYGVVNHTDYGNAKLVRSTTPANTLSVDASHLVAVPDTQKVDVNTIKTATVAASSTVTFQNGSIPITTSIMEGDLVKIHGTALTETAGQLAAGFVKVFDVATPVFTAESVNQTGDAFAGLSDGSVTLDAAYDAAKTAAQAGDEMDLVDAPNATALTAIATSWGAKTGSITSLAYQLLLERVYEMLSNKMIVTEATGAIALRNIADDADIATGSVVDGPAETTRGGLTWA